MSTTNRVASAFTVAVLLTVLQGRRETVAGQTGCTFPADSTTTMWLQGVLDGPVSVKAREVLGLSGRTGAALTQQVVKMPSATEYVHPDFLPFTIDELVAADVALGMDAAESLASWERVRSMYTSTDNDRGTAGYASLGMVGFNELLDALAAQSADLSARVTDFRRNPNIP